MKPGNSFTQISTLATSAVVLILLDRTGLPAAAPETLRLLSEYQKETISG